MRPAARGPRARTAGFFLAVLLAGVWCSAGAPASGGSDEAHWAYRPVRRPPVPAVASPWVRNPVDSFILSRLRAVGLAPSPPAARAYLLRRTYLDLIGLPPTPEEVAEFLRNPAPDAFERVVRRLLNSPHYGERWAQHWLDVVRFGETNGFEVDGERPQAWRYRDYVVKALNSDLPYDEFIRHQLAGDELALKTPEGPWPASELQAATGFLRAGPAHVVGGNQEPAVMRQEWLTEAVNGVSAAFLGVTIHCARCHSHKYDPISQKEYYRIQAFLSAAQDTEIPIATPREKSRHQSALRAVKERMAPLQAQIAALERPYREALQEKKRAALDPEYARVLALAPAARTPEEAKLAQVAQVQLKVSWDEIVAALTPADREKRSLHRKRMHAIEAESPEPPASVPAVTDAIRPAPPARLLFRGDPLAPRDEVQPGVPAALNGGETDLAIEPVGDRSTGRRLALADWIASAENRLTGRVLVNRIWKHHFGQGLVATPNDFGKNGSRPTHPELLDWLANWFTTPPARGGAGWSLKRLHELLVTSAVYRQASVQDPARARKDPGNRLLWRMNRPRLDAETLRDSVLAAAGTLNRQLGGPSIKVPLEPEVYDTIFTEGEPDNLWPVHPDVGQHTRRTLYLLRKRNVRLPLLVVLDAPDLMNSCGAREESTHSLQALTLMNSDFMTAQSRALAERVLREGLTDADRVSRLFTFVLGREPFAGEAASTLRFLRGAGGSDAAWHDASLALLNCNEFVYRP